MIVLSRRAAGTNNLSWGHSVGTSSSVLACSISVIMSYWIGDTMRVGVITFSGILGSESFSNCRDRASAFVFLEPGK